MIIVSETERDMKMQTQFKTMIEAIAHFVELGYQPMIEYAGFCVVMVQENGHIDAPMVELFELGSQGVHAETL